MNYGYSNNCSCSNYYNGNDCDQATPYDDNVCVGQTREGSRNQGSDCTFLLFIIAVVLIFCR